MIFIAALPVVAICGDTHSDFSMKTSDWETLKIYKIYTVAGYFQNTYFVEIFNIYASYTYSLVGSRGY